MIYLTWLPIVLGCIGLLIGILSRNEFMRELSLSLLGGWACVAALSRYQTGHGIIWMFIAFGCVIITAPSLRAIQAPYWLPRRERRAMAQLFGETLPQLIREMNQRKREAK